MQKIQYNCFVVIQIFKTHVKKNNEECEIGADFNSDADDFTRVGGERPGDGRSRMGVLYKLG